MTPEICIDEMRKAMQFAALSITNQKPDNARAIIHHALNVVDKYFPEEDNPNSMIAKGWRP